MAWRTENKESVLDTRRYGPAEFMPEGMTNTTYDYLKGMGLDPHEVVRRGGARVDARPTSQDRRDAARRSFHDDVEREMERIGPLVAGEPIRRRDAGIIAGRYVSGGWPNPATSTKPPGAGLAHVKAPIVSPFGDFSTEASRRAAFAAATRAKSVPDDEETPEEQGTAIEDARAAMMDRSANLWKDSKRNSPAAKKQAQLDSRRSARLQQEDIKRNLGSSGNAGSALAAINGEQSGGRQVQGSSPTLKYPGDPLANIRAGYR